MLIKLCSDKYQGMGEEEDEMEEEGEEDGSKEDVG